MAFYIEHRVGVAAPAPVIWAILSDIEGWPAWVDAYRKASGVLRIGETVAIDQMLPGEEAETVRYTVLDWAPDMQIHLRMRLFAGLLVATRYMEIETLSEEGCIFSSGEMFRGPAARFMPRRLRGALRQTLLQMSDALKQRAEAAWAAQKA
jgi:hypothetical protein